MFRKVYMNPLRAGHSYVLQRGLGKPDVKLTVEKLIGGGGQAAIYKGTMTNLGDVAIRTIRITSDITMNAVKKEISVLKNTRLSAKENKHNESNVEGCNPHINCYYGMIKYGRLVEDGGEGPTSRNVPMGNEEPFVYWTTEPLHDYIYLIYEFIDGKPLFEKINEGLTPEQIISYGHQLLIGIDSLHRENKVHLDLKPENIMITKTDVLKIIDFGFARDVTDVFIKPIYWRSYSYFAPECWELGSNPSTEFALFVRTRLINPKAIDMFSIGCIFYAMITQSLLINDNFSASMTFQDRDPNTIVLPSEYSKYEPFVRKLVSVNMEILGILTEINNIPSNKEFGVWVQKVASDAKVTSPEEQARNVRLILLKRFKSTIQKEPTGSAPAKKPVGSVPAKEPATAVALGGAGAEAPAAVPKPLPAAAATARPPLALTVGNERPSASQALKIWCKLNEIPAERCGGMAGGRRKSRQRHTHHRKHHTRRRR